MYAQHKFLVKGHKLNIGDIWACLISCTGGYNDMFPWPQKYIFIWEVLKTSHWKTFV